MKNSEGMSDLAICKEKILLILREYNCQLMDLDEGGRLLLMDNDTRQTIGIIGN